MYAVGVTLHIALLTAELAIVVGGGSVWDERELADFVQILVICRQLIEHKSGDFIVLSFVVDAHGQEVGLAEWGLVGRVVRTAQFIAQADLSLNVVLAVDHHPWHVGNFGHQCGS